MTTGALLVCVLASAGCATSRPRSDISTLTSARTDTVSGALPSGDVLGSLATIGVVAGRVPREATVSTRTARGDAAWRGAKDAAKMTFVGFTLACLQPTELFLFQLVACPIAGAALAPVGGGVGAIVEAARAEGRAAIEGAPATTLGAVTGANVPGAIRDRVARLGTEWTRARPWRFVALTDEDSDARDGQVLAERGVGRLLEVNVDSVGLVTWKADVNSPLALVLTVQVRLLTLPDLSVVHEHSLRWESPPASLGSWLAHDGTRLREAAGQASRDLADRIMDEVFLLFPPVDRLPAVEPRVVKAKIGFLEDGGTTRAESLDRLGEPTRQYEGGRIVTYAMWEDIGGALRVSAPSNPKASRYRLVLVFGPDDRLEQHRLVPVDTP